MTEFEYQRFRARTAIRNAVINVTNACNLRCPYCFTEANNRVIDMETMKAAINFVLDECDRISGDKRPPTIYFFGGEPMLQFEQIIVPTVEWTEVSGLRDKYNILFGMTTNGTLLTEDRLNWLDKHEVNILLSIDGDKQTQDSQRPGPNGASSFDLLFAKLPVILKHFPSVTFRSTVEPYNAKKIYENYLFARRTGFSSYFLTPNTFADWSMDQITTAMKQLSLIAETIYQDISNGSSPLVWSELISFMQACFKENKPETIGLRHCGIGAESVGIAVNGDINGCQEHNTYLEHDIFYIGNIYEGIDSEKHLRLLNAYQALPHPICREDPSRCQTCSFYKECSSHFCPSHNLLAGTGAAENSLITCIWNGFVKDLSYTILEQTVAEKNQKMVRFLEQCAGLNVAVSAH